MNVRPFVDSHCHIPIVAEESGEQAGEILERARNAGVGHMLCVCVDLASAPGVLALAQSEADVSASVGVHPNADLLASEPDAARLIALGCEPEIVAIGETGLDYFRSTGDLTWQRDRFRAHITAAKELGKPLIIHTRDSAADVIEVLRQARADEVGGVMHCFVDDWDTASAAMDLGFYISFSGIVSFKSAKQVQDVARRVPFERMLIETDSPWLAPVPHRGKRNEPAYVGHVAAFIAGLREMRVEEVAAQTAENFERLFKVRLPQPTV
ncbi:MAG: TatD family hydrolase [Gammaproteobacteria bacterium]|nr:TatD family hydrolase [Gammaproteobacteria bacterium]